MTVSIFRILLLGLFIWAVIRLVMYLRPKPAYLLSFLDYPRHNEIDEIEEGEFVRLWPSSTGRVINVYRKGLDEGEGLLGQLPSKYYDAIEPVIRRGQLYQATVVDHTGENVRLEIQLRIRPRKDEFV